MKDDGLTKNQRYYRKKTEEEKVKARAITKKYKQSPKGRAALAKYMETRTSRVAPYKDVPCMDCGNKFPSECMDFDHREEGEKFKDISRMGTYSMEKILEEIVKCDVVCANCHRIRTRLRGIGRKQSEETKQKISETHLRLNEALRHS
jgi:hypothetical protein